MSRLNTTQLSRRQALGAITSVASVAIAAGCGGSSPTSPTPTATTTTGTTGTGSTTTTGGNSSSGTCVAAPNETAGPYPDRLGMLNNQSFYRRDVTEGRPGVPLTLVLSVVSTSNGCNPVTNAAVEIWHCDAVGNYSEYGTTASQTFLRGLQATDSTGKATFSTIYPGWYQGRATHIHLEVFVNNASVKTTQMAFPDSESNLVHVTGVYASRGTNPTRTASDGIFSDGFQTQLALLSGSPSTGYTATLTLGI